MDFSDSLHNVSDGRLQIRFCQKWYLFSPHKTLEVTINHQQTHQVGVVSMLDHVNALHQAFRLHAATDCDLRRLIFARLDVALIVDDLDGKRFFCHFVIAQHDC